MDRTTRGFAIGVLTGVVIVMVASRGHVDRMTFGDGVFVRYVAEHPGASISSVPTWVAQHGPAARYGRILLPILLRVFSWGSPSAMRFVQPVILVLAAGATAAAATQLLPALATPVAGVVAFAAAGFSLSLAGGFADPVSIALFLWAVVACERNRWIEASLLIGAAMLTRESLVFGLGGIVLWLLIGRKMKSAVVLGASLIPVVAWQFVVSRRFGHLPVADPYYSHAGFERFGALSVVFSSNGLPTKSIAALHIGSAIVALTRWKRSLLWCVAAVAGLQLGRMTFLTWSYQGDAMRVLAPFEIAFVLAMARSLSSVVGARPPDMT